MTRSPARRHLAVAAACGVFTATMFGAAFAAVPLYDWLCRVTGMGGTTQVAAAAPDRVLAREVTVRFDANVAPGLTWRFEPVEPRMRVRLGEPNIARYRVTNYGQRATVGSATYNVTPLSTGAHFAKIQCFCFIEQRLAPGQSEEFVVSFFVDPRLAEDRGARGVDTITLSYTFHPVRNPAPLAAAGAPAVVR
jgi:cytochrome c oxidase assembly protein subunit 11